MDTVNTLDIDNRVDDDEPVSPTRIRVEASSYCQLRCPTCPTTTGETHRGIGAGFLKFEDFEKLVADNPGIEEIELSNYGEIFLNPDIAKMLRHADENGVVLTARNGVNLNTVSDDVLEALVKYRFRHLRVSIDGASQESYVQYRIRGKFDRVMANVRKINEFKAAYGSEFPHLTWQFVVFGHNEHEIADARAMAAELGMEFRPKLNWDESFSPVRNKDLVRQEMEEGVASRAEYLEQNDEQYTEYICHQLWDWPQINWNGDVLGCCRNNWGNFGGNVFRDGMVEALNNDTIQHGRRMLLGLEEARDDVPCTTCRLYKTMRKQGRVLKR